MTTKNLTSISLLSNINDNVNLIAETDGQWARVNLVNLLSNLATKDELNSLATKDDLNPLAPKENPEFINSISIDNIVFKKDPNENRLIIEFKEV